MVQGQGGQGSNAGASGVADMEKPSGLLPPVSKRGSLNEAKEAETHDKLNLPERRKSQVRFATPEQNTLIPVSVLSPGTRGANSCNAGKPQLGDVHAIPPNLESLSRNYFFCFSWIALSCLFPVIPCVSSIISFWLSQQSAVLSDRAHTQAPGPWLLCP